MWVKICIFVSLLQGLYSFSILVFQMGTKILLASQAGGTCGLSWTLTAFGSDTQLLPSPLCSVFLAREST